jgi:hypothetical protein
VGIIYVPERTIFSGKLVIVTWMLIFWVATPFGLHGERQPWYLAASPRGVTPRNTNVDILSAVRSVARSVLYTPRSVARELPDARNGR